ncbi:MAG TPA: ATP synthase F1 subunit delta [Candidatus Limnocylindria bacterium]|jgi:F-type H+-transporting ATPase subunit delta|nr:ATP synthase F1 subunit delta [Candidatus Limnocylindria bacterium]
MPVSGSVARRYAEALLSLAPDERAVSRYRASLEQLAPVFDRMTIAGLRNPAVPLKQRQEAIAAALKDEPAEIRSLVLLLLERDRLLLVPQIARAFGDLVDQREGIAKARVTTAVPLDDGERADVVRRLERASGRKVRATFAVDPTLIGGAKVQLGDHLIDSSLYARLAELGRQLAS